MENKIFYQTALALMLQDIKNGKLVFTVEDAERFYSVFGITSTLKNGKIVFGGNNE